MNPTLFAPEVINEALARLFPDLDTEVRNDFTDKLLMHLFVYAKETLFVTPQEIELVEKVLESTTGKSEQPAILVDMFNAKLTAMSEQAKLEFQAKISDELARKGNEFYLAMTQPN